MSDRTDEGHCARLIREGLALDAMMTTQFPADRTMALVLVEKGTASDDEVRVANETVRRATDNRVGVMVGELHDLARTPDAPVRAHLSGAQP